MAHSASRLASASSLAKRSLSRAANSSAVGYFSSMTLPLAGAAGAFAPFPAAAIASAAALSSLVNSRCTVFAPLILIPATSIS
jgi:hypothetical protein